MEMDVLNPFRLFSQVQSFHPSTANRAFEAEAFTSGINPTDSLQPSGKAHQAEQLLPSPFKAANREIPPINVREKEWCVTENDTSYVIDSGGCGAIKIFVDADESSYSIVFHSDGTQESKEEAAPDISSYLLSQKNKPQNVRILCIQPYSVSRDVMESVYKINHALEEEGIPTSLRSVCLNNIEGEKHSKFIRLDLAGSEEQILGRYDDLLVKSRDMSEEDRARKIKLFQTVPMSLRTSEFLKNWSSLSVEEAKQLVDGLRKKESKWTLRQLFSRAA